MSWSPWILPSLSYFHLSGIYYSSCCACAYCRVVCAESLRSTAYSNWFAAAWVFITWKRFPVHAWHPSPPRPACHRCCCRRSRFKMNRLCRRSSILLVVYACPSYLVGCIFISLLFLLGRLVPGLGNAQRREQLVSSLLNLSEIARACIDKTRPVVQAIARKIYKRQHCFVLGKGISFTFSFDPFVIVSHSVRLSSVNDIPLLIHNTFFSCFLIVRFLGFAEPIAEKVLWRSRKSHICTRKDTQAGRWSMVLLLWLRVFRFHFVSTIYHSFRPSCFLSFQRVCLLSSSYWMISMLLSCKRLLQRCTDVLVTQSSSQTNLLSLAIQPTTLLWFLPTARSLLCSQSFRFSSWLTKLQFFEALTPTSPEI